MPEHDPEQELGPKLTSAFRDRADAAPNDSAAGLAQEARRRVRKRRSTLSAAAAVVAVAVVIGGGWSLTQSGTESSSTSAADSKSGAGEAAGNASGKTTQGMAPAAPTPVAQPACPPDHAILKADGPNSVPAGTGLDLQTPVKGLEACRYSIANGVLLGQQAFTAQVAQQVVDAIKVLPERNPALPVFKCTPQAAVPAEAIVLRFTTADGIREIWVQYDGCDTAGFFTGAHTYGLYAAPLKLFMIGTVRPAGGTFLSALKGW
ncbi:hypothetical protein [Kribbella sp. NPDC055071]